MKIAVIGPTYPYKGGISHFTTILVQNLRKIHDVDFISWKRQYPSFLYPVELKDTQSKKPIQADARFILDFYNPFSWMKAVMEIKKQKTDKLLITWVSPVQAPIYFVVSYFTKKWTKTKILYICHNVLPHEESAINRPLTKLALCQGDEFIVHSTADKKKLEKLVNNKQIVLGFHPIYDIFNTGEKYDIEKNKKELKLKKKVLLFFGYIRPYKGLKYLIKAMPGILKNYPDTSLLVVGDFWSKDKQSYFDLIKELKLEKDIVMINKYIPNEEIGKYFSIADVAVFPYTSATQSGTIQIARAFKIPVIATMVDGLVDSFENGQIDIVIKAKDSEDIIEQVKYFYSSFRKKSQNVANRDWHYYTNLLAN